MSNHLLVWLQLALSGGLVIWGGSVLARKTKLLSEQTGLTELWLGFIMLAAVTSIPELATSVGAVVLVHSPALALGDLLGSNSFNIFVIVLLNAFLFRASLIHRASWDSFKNLFQAAAGMTSLVLPAIWLDRYHRSFTILNADPASWLIIILYLITSIRLYRMEHPPAEKEKRHPAAPLPGKLYLSLAFSALIVVAGAFWLAKTGRQIAEITGWGETFVGALFLALVTSLPEVAVCVAAVRLGSPELGLGNILGSNIFNLAVVFPTDLAYPGGSIMEKGNASTGVAAGMGILLTLVLAAAIKFKAARPRRWGWETISIILIYLGGMYLLFHLS